MVESVLIQLGIIISLATILALLGRGIKQPTIIAYLITGIIVGPLFLGIISSTELVELFTTLGITFLLFVIGLSLDFRVFKHVGKVAIIVGFVQAVVIALASFLIASKLLGIQILPSIYLAGALSISSTVVVVNLLSEKKELETLHGKIAFGILIIQDFIASLILMTIPFAGAALETANFFLIGMQILKGIALIGFVFLVAASVIPRVLNIAARNQELLFLFSITWAFLIAIFFHLFNFYIEIGALIAGMSLASSNFSHEIAGKIKGLREFFILIHLVFFGSLLIGPITNHMIFSALTLSVLILIGNPLIIMTLMKLFGYKKRANFFTGISIAQISEFSLIIIFLALRAGILSQQIMSLTVLVALITIGISSYGIFYSEQLYNFLSPALKIFDAKGPYNRYKKTAFDVILFGYNRIGFSLLKSFEENRKRYLVVDYNPEVIEELKKKKIHCIYGDANDIEFLNDLPLENAQIIISTIPDLEINLGILEEIDNPKTIFIATSHEISHTEKLYKEGTDYVIMPHFLGGNFMADLLSKKEFDKNLLKKHSQKQLNELAERRFYGHNHPHKDSHGV